MACFVLMMYRESRLKRFKSLRQAQSIIPDLEVALKSQTPFTCNFRSVVKCPGQFTPIYNLIQAKNL